MEPFAHLIEIFSSIQGEGTHVGERQLFVRFQGCSLACQYCDTPASFVKSSKYRVETIPFSKKFDTYDNPISLMQLNDRLQSFADDVLSITGGEPLEQISFLKVWLPTLKQRYRVLLETAGVDGEALCQILDWVDIVSMDIKLPSVTGLEPMWEAHRRFAAVAKDKELYVKVVLSSKTEEQDLAEATRIIAEQDPDIPFVLQPAAPFGKFCEAPSLAQLKKWQRQSETHLSDVRIIPQLHKSLQVL